MLLPANDPHDSASILALALAAAVVAAGGVYLTPSSPAESITAAKSPTATTRAIAAASAITTARRPTRAASVTVAPAAATTRAVTVTATATLIPTVVAVTTVPLTTTTTVTTTGQGAAVTLLAPPAPLFTFQRPFSFQNAVEASRYYPYGTTGHGEYLLHHGIDIGNAMGTPVLAVGDGEVVYAGDDVQRLWGPQADFYGNVVVIRHPQTLAGQALYSLYGHLSRVKTEAGATVKAGEEIAEVGMAGIALGPHLHLEIRVGDPEYESTRNAELFLAPLPGRGTILGRVAGTDGSRLPGVAVGLYQVDASGQETYYGETTTYPRSHVHPIAELGETFVFADLPAGRYAVHADRGGPRASAAVTVTDGSALFVDLGG